MGKKLEQQQQKDQTPTIADNKRVEAVLDLERKQAPLTMKQEKLCNNGWVERFLTAKIDNVKKAVRACLSWGETIGIGNYGKVTGLLNGNDSAGSVSVTEEVQKQGLLINDVAGPKEADLVAGVDGAVLNENGLSKPAGPLALLNDDAVPISLSVGPPSSVSGLRIVGAGPLPVAVGPRLPSSGPRLFSAHPTSASSLGGPALPLAGPRPFSRGPPSCLELFSPFSSNKLVPYSPSPSHLSNVQTTSDPVISLESSLTPPGEQIQTLRGSSIGPVETKEQLAILKRRVDKNNALRTAPTAEKKIEVMKHFGMIDGEISEKDRKRIYSYVNLGPSMYRSRKKKCAIPQREGRKRQLNGLTDVVVEYGGSVTPKKLQGPVSPSGTEAATAEQYRLQI